MNKKLIVFSLLTICMLSLFSGFANAGLGDVWDDISGSKFTKVIFVDIGESLEEGTDPSLEAKIVVKILFGLLFFALLFGGTALAPGIKDFSKNIRIAISFLIAAIASVAIPPKWIFSVIQTYGGGFILALLFVPIIILVYANFKWVEGKDRGTTFKR